MKLLTEKEVKEIKTLLNTHKKIVIVTHRNPDGDAIGSSLGMEHFLLQKGHSVNVVTPNDYPKFLHWLPGNEKVLEFDRQKDNAGTLIQKAEIIFCLDFTDLRRIGDMETIVAASTAVKIHIDHHQQPDDFADYLFSDTTRASTAELVYDFIVLLGEKHLIDKHTADCIYTGIMTDTASFRYPATTSMTHKIVAELIDCGADNAKIFDSIYDNNSEKRIRFLGYCISEKLKVFPEYHTAMIIVNKKELKRFNNKKGDTEGFVNYALSVSGVRFAAFFVERKNIVKVSFRSKGNFCVNKFAKKHFNGGGHSNAAGGETELPLKNAVDKFTALLSKYKDELNRSDI